MLAVVLILIFSATGCITLKKQAAAPSKLGGAFFTDDRFETWKHRSQLMTPGETPGTIGGVDVYFMKFDPSDSDAIYVGTRADGLYYSYNGGLGWMKSERLPAGLVRDLAVDNKNKCRLYAAVDTRIFKSEDCARSWVQIYYTDNAEKLVTALAIDWYDPNVIYSGLSDGSVLKSENMGVSWRMVNQLKKRIFKIMVDPHDSRNVYVGVESTGLFKSMDKGETWQDLNKAMKDYKESKSYYDFDLSVTVKNMIIYANKYGLLRSLDGGDTWLEVKLLTPPASEIIYSLAIDPTNANYIYYSTNSAVYKTLDAGVNWVVKKTPTTRVASEIIVHPKEPAKIFVGVKEIAE